jgi:NAD(P)-dependent dehydrogenase (short-subunit alcohol dehydrogenase family)
MKLEGAVIAVTGGASGLGAATAQLCTEKGAKVAVLDMNKAPPGATTWWLIPRNVSGL